jgi:hypothetical protein
VPTPAAKLPARTGSTQKTDVRDDVLFRLCCRCGEVKKKTEKDANIMRTPLAEEPKDSADWVEVVAPAPPSAAAERQQQPSNDFAAESDPARTVEDGHDDSREENSSEQEGEAERARPLSVADQVTADSSFAGRQEKRERVRRGVASRQFSVHQRVRCFHKPSGQWINEAVVVGIHHDDGPDKPHCAIRCILHDNSGASVEKQTTSERLMATNHLPTEREQKNNDAEPDLLHLSMKELKRLLTERGTGHGDCVEKRELVEQLVQSEKETGADFNTRQAGKNPAIAPPPAPAPPPPAPTTGVSSPTPTASAGPSAQQMFRSVSKGLGQSLKNVVKDSRKMARGLGRSIEKGAKDVGKRVGCGCGSIGIELSSRHCCVGDKIRGQCKLCSVCHKV